jgi:hypothetical protein
MEDIPHLSTRGSPAWGWAGLEGSRPRGSLTHAGSSGMGQELGYEAQQTEHHCPQPWHQSTEGSTCPSHFLEAGEMMIIQGTSDIKRPWRPSAPEILRFCGQV